MTTDDMTMNVTTDSDMKEIRYNSIMTRAGGAAATLLHRMMMLLLTLVAGGMMNETWAQTLPDGVTGYETVTITIPATNYDADAGGTGLGAPQMAKVKFNRQFPLVITSDDGRKPEYISNWALMNGYPNVRDWQDYPYPNGDTFLGIAYDRTYMGTRSNDVNDYEPMTFDDGTGHSRRFTLTSAVPPNGSSKTAAEASYDQINRDDAKAMLRTGFSFAQHDVDNEYAGSVETIKDDYTRQNQLWADRVGIGLKVMVEPNGNKNYVTAAEQSDEIAWNIYQGATQDHPALDNTLAQWTGGTTPSTFPNTHATTRTFPNSDAAGETAFANSVRTAITNGSTDPMFYGCHGLGTYAQNLLKDLATNASYKDKVWVTGADEFWEYYHIYNNIVIENVRYADGNLTFDVKVPTYKKNQFRELTINIPGLTGTGAPTFSGADGSKVITGSYSTDGGTGIGYTMNIGLESSITTHIDQLLTVYRDDQTNAFVKRDAQYLIDQLWDKTAYQTRLDANPTYDIAVKASLGGTEGPTLATIKTDTDGNKQFSVPRYIVSDGKLYETTAQASQPYYKPTVSTSAGAPAAIGYTEKDLTALAGNITPVAVSVVEGEDMAGAKVLGAKFNSEYPIKIASGGLAGGVVSDGALKASTSLPRGSYKAIIGYGETWKAQGTFNYQVLVDGTQVHTFSNASAANNAVTEFTTAQFDITADGQPVTITTDNTNMNSRWIDYVIFVQTSSLDPVAPSITATASAGTAASVKVGTSITITATAAQNGGSNFTGTTIYQCSDAAGTIDGEAKATSATESATYTFTPNAAGTYYFKAVASDGTLGSNTTEVITVNVVADIDEYTLVIIDKSGGEAMTTTVQSSALTTDPLPGKLRSPYAENYKYYTTKAEAQANSGSSITDLAGFTQETIYVGYDVKSDGLKFDGSKPYVIYANSRYLHGVFREDQAHVTANMWGLQRQSYDSWNSSNNNVTTTTFPFLDGSYLWYLLGGDPYNIRLQNKAARRYTSHENNANAGYRAGFTTDAASSARYCLVYWNGSTSAADYCALWNRDHSMYVYMNGGADNGSWRLDANSSRGEGKIYIAGLPQLNINVLNPGTHEVEYTCEGRFMSGASLPSAIPFYLQRAFTSGQAFYYTKADAIAGENAISGTPDASNMTNDGSLNIYVTYTLDSSNWGTEGTVKPSVDENDAYWMSMTFPDGSRKLEAANSGTYEVGPSQTTVTTETPKLQWGFVGTPYSFRLINRANSGRVMGVDKSTTAATNAVMFENPGTSIACDWEMVNYKNGGGSTNPLIRLRGSISGETPLLFVLSQANQKTLSTTEANNNRISSFTLIEEVHPAVPPTVTLTTTAASSVETGTVVTLKATPVWNGTTALTSLQFQYKVTGGADGDWENIGEAITPITSGTEYTKEFTPASSGTYSFRAVVTDADGTTGTSASDSATPTGDSEGLVTLSVVDDLLSDATYSYKMKATLKDGDTEIASQWLHEVESESALTNQHYFFPRYILNGTTLYEVTANTPTRSENDILLCSYANYRNVDAQNLRDNLTYNKVAGKDNVVFFGEAEDISGSSNIRCPNSSNTNQFNWNSAEGRFTWYSSMGYGLRTNGSYGTVTTLPAGKYTITIGLVGSSGTKAVDDTNSQIVTVGGNEVEQFKYTATGDGNLIECTTKEFSIYSEQSVVISHSESKNNGLDYVYIQRTGDANVTAPTVTLSVTDANSKAIEANGESLVNTAVTLKATATMNGGASLKTLKFQYKTGSGEWTTISTVATPTSGTECTATYTPSATGTVYFRALATTDVDGTSELTGYSQSNTEDDATAFAVSVVTALTINEYTLHVIDNEGHDVFGDAITITKAEKDGLASGQDPLVTLRPQYASPFVSSYLYFNTAADAQANSGTATTWDRADIYVGYTVDATKMGADKVHAIWANNNQYMHIIQNVKNSTNSQSSSHNAFVIQNQQYDVTDAQNTKQNSNVYCNTLPILDNSYMWQLGTDPYNFKLKNMELGMYCSSNSINSHPTVYDSSEGASATSYCVLYWQSKAGVTDATQPYYRIVLKSAGAATENILMAKSDSWQTNNNTDGNWDSKGKIYIKELPAVNINILNAENEVECTLQGYYKSDATMPGNSTDGYTPHNIERVYTSQHKWYYSYTSAEVNDPVAYGSVLSTTKLEGSPNLYVKYTLDTSKWGTVVKNADTNYLKPFTDSSEEYDWYYILSTNNSAKPFQAASGTLPATVTHCTVSDITTNTATDDSKRGQWAFTGTPYNVKIINRYYGANAYVGIHKDDVTINPLKIYAAGTADVFTSFEALSRFGGSDNIFLRPTAVFNGNAPYLYLGHHNSGSGETHTAVIDNAGANSRLTFHWVDNSPLEHPSTVHLTASTTTPYVDDPVTLTATATPDNIVDNNVTYLVIEQETSTDVWDQVGRAYNAEEPATASMKDVTTKAVTATYTFTPSGAGTYKFRARAVIDDATQYSTDAASAGGDGSPVTITASVYTLVVGSNNYTLILVDKQGNELFTESNVPASRVSETNSISGRNGDPIDNSWRSPLVARYYYYSTKADAQSNSGQYLFDWSSTAATPTVYVGYATGTDIDLNSAVTNIYERVNRSGDDDTQVRDASKFGTMYMLKFLNGVADYLENGKDAVETSTKQPVYPYANGDGAMYIYDKDRWDDQAAEGASTRTRWPWYLVSPTNDPYHVYVTAWQQSHTNSANKTNYYNFFRTYYNTTINQLVTTTISDDPRVRLKNETTNPNGSTAENGGSDDNVPTEYMVLGTTGAYKLITTNGVTGAADDATYGSRQTVKTFENYWKNNPTVQTLAGENPDANNSTLTGKGWHQYKAWANAADWGSDSKTKTFKYDNHWYKTFDMGDGTFDLEPTEIDAVLVLLDNHGWEVMRQKIAKHKETTKYEVAKANLKKYDSPMVKEYKFYASKNVDHKVSGYHKYNINNGVGKALTEDERVGSNQTFTSLAQYPEKYSGGALIDLYATYDVKEEYTNSYTPAATEAECKASQFLVLQGNKYAKANGTAIAGVTELASADAWYLKPNFNIDTELGYTGEAVAYTKAQNGFDPYNLRIQNVTTSTYFTTNATQADLTGSIWSGDGTTVSLTDATSYFTDKGLDDTDVKISNATFMAVQDANGNMRLMPRFDHSHVIEGFTALAEPASAQPANDTSHEQTTRLTTGTITYHIIDDSGNDVFGGQSYTGPGFAIDRTLQSPMVEEYYFHSSEQDAKDNRTTATKTSIGLNDEVWVSYKAKADFSTATWNIWNTSGLYMHAVSRNGESNAANLWWMSNQNQDRQNNAATTTLSTSTMPFLDNSFAWQFGTDPYNTTLLNKAAHRYVKQNEVTSNNGRMDHLVTDAASATPYAILYYDNTQTNGNAILYDRTHSRYVRADGNEWRINSTNRETTGELVITQLPALNINIVNAGGEVECMLQGYYKSGCTWTLFVPLYLERLHTSGQKFYYTLADATADTSDPEYVDKTITGTVNDNTITTNGAVYVKYTLDAGWSTLTTTGETNNVMPSPTDNKIQWYAIKSKNQVRYFQAGTSADSELSNTTTQPGSTDSDLDKRGQWALIGTPYNLKLVNRYHGMADYLGVPETGNEKAYVYSSEEGHVTTWEVVTGMGGQTGGLQIRPQRSLNGETTYGYVGFGGSATGVYANPNGNLNNVLIWLKETPAKNITFKLYAPDGNAMTLAAYGGIADKMMTGYAPGDNLQSVFEHTGLARRFCEYTFYSGYDGDKKEFSTVVTTASSDNDETVYVKWDYTDDAPVFNFGVTNTRDYQYYMMSQSNGNYSYTLDVKERSGGTGYDFLVDGNVTSVRAYNHQFALVGNPYAFKLYSRKAGLNIRRNAAYQLTFDEKESDGETATQEIVFDTPMPTVTPTNTQFYIRSTTTGNYMTSTAGNFSMSPNAMGFARLEDIIIPIHVFKEGETAADKQVDYRQYAMALNPDDALETTARVTADDLRQTGNAQGVAYDFRHAFCDYTYYRTYDWDTGDMDNPIATDGTDAGLPYYGGKEQYKRQFFATYTVDEENFGKLYLIGRPDAGNPGKIENILEFFGKGTVTTDGDYTYYGTSRIQGLDNARNDTEETYRWQMIGDPYNLQLFCRGTGADYMDYPLGAKVNTDASSDAPTKDNGQLMMLTNDATYARNTHWEIIERHNGNYVFFLREDVDIYEPDDPNRYQYSLGQHVTTDPALEAIAGRVELLLALAIPQYTITWHVMESDGSATPTYTDVANKDVVVEEKTVLTLADLPQELKRHFCLYNNMYSDNACTTAIADNTLTVNAHGNIYVPYTLDSGAPEFIKTAPTGEPTGVEPYWYEIHFPSAGSYIYYDDTNLNKDHGDISNIRSSTSSSGKGYDHYRWALVGSPYSVKFYNMSTKIYLTTDGTRTSMGTGTEFDMLDDVYYDGDLCLIYDAMTNTYINANGLVQTDNGAWASAEFSNVNGVVKIAFILHYSGETLRKYDATDGDDSQSDKLDNETEGNAAGTTETIMIETFQKLNKKLDEVFPTHWKRAFCDYTYYWDNSSRDNTEVDAITEQPKTVTQAMVEAYNSDTSQPIYVHVTYDYSNSPFHWSTKDLSWEGKHWYYLVNNHIQGTERGKMVFRDSSPKLRVSTGLVDNRQYLNYFEWCVIGDPYGFKMLNHYDPDHKFNEYISVTTTREGFGNTGVQLEQQESNPNHLFEMMPGKNSNNFWMHPIYKSDYLNSEYTGGAYHYIGNNGNGSAAIMPDTKYSQNYLRTNSSANFRLEIRTDETLKEYVTYKNYVGSLKPDVIADTDNSTLFEALANGTATPEQLKAIHDLVDNPNNLVPMKQGYYRIVPYSSDKNRRTRSYVRGYLYGPGSQESGDVEYNVTPQKGLADDVTTANAIYNLATIFWFGSTTEVGNTYPRYYIQSQGMGLTGNQMDTGNGFKSRYEDLGAAICQLKTNDDTDPTHAYLSSTTSGRTNTNQCFDEQAGYYKTRFYLQPVGSEADNLLPLKLQVYPGKYTPSGSTTQGDYYFGTLYVPYDVVVADDDAYAYAGKLTKTDSSQDWRLQCEKLSAQTVGSKTYDKGKFIPAGTPVLIRATTAQQESSFKGYNYDRKDANAYYVTLVIPNDAPAAGLSKDDTFFKGQYLEQVLSASAEGGLPDTGESVYVFGQATDEDYKTIPDDPRRTGMKYEAGFYVNKNTVDGSTDYDGKHNNLYVRHNKIYLFEKSVETNYEAHNAPSSARTRGDFIALDFGDGIEEVNGGTGMMMSPEGVYDMQGRRIASGQAAEDGTWRKDVRPGVYIVNGRKIVIR